MDYAHPEYLISVQELQQQLGQPRLKVFDTCVHLRPIPNGYQIDSGHADYLAAHIPGAGFIDVAEDWADTSTPLRFTLPELNALRRAIGASGISAQDQVVLYSSGHLMWATRAWWLLYHAGHRNMRILNGNFTAWREAGYEIASGGTDIQPVTFTATESVACFADTAAVEAGMEGRVCTLNALSNSLYEGTGDFYYTRPGHIPGSTNLYYDSLLDNEHFRSAEEISVALERLGALQTDAVITYCGGGIAATLDAFACLLVGQENVQVYDGSMSEWVSDPARPLRTGANP
ncbi:MAG: sulfurtransferase [Pseudomonadota bacterium]